jgi:superoxide dismutase, Fe-Mn family
MLMRHISRNFPAMAHEQYAQNPGELHGISAKTNDIHHGKLYAAYVNKRNEIEALLASTDPAGANQIYSVWRGLKEGETFAANGMILHQVLFGVLGGDGNPAGTQIETAITQRWGSWGRFVAEFTAAGMAARGWAILAYDSFDKQLHIYTGDAQNHGGVWGSMPLIPMDVYEHAYFLDFGADRAAYIAAFLQNINWGAVSAEFEKLVSPGA